SGQGADIYKLNSVFRIEHEYFPSMQERGVGFYIPPFATPLLAALGLLPPGISYLFFLSASCLSVLFSVHLLGRTFSLKLQGKAWLFAGLCLSGPLFESLKIAQLAPFLLFSISLFLLLSKQKKDYQSGAALSLLLLKPQELLPLALYLLAKRKLKVLASLILLTLVLAAISLSFLGPEGYNNYLELLKDSAANTRFMQPELSATFRGQFLRLCEPANQMANLASAALLLLSLLLIFGQAVFNKESKEPETLLSFALPLGLLSALHCHDYDLLLLAPWGLSLYLQKDTNALTKAAKIAISILFALLSLPLYVPIHYQWLLTQKAALNPIFIAFLAACVLSILQVRASKTPTNS
ncbi:MAG: glycosyltransferase 87 family protein, partial [Candidatus Obscuribacterales bacterium]|nr:glycosyltransferase 87 family protein [Candidatus Obscuribacterales bacterium]